MSDVLREVSERIISLSHPGILRIAVDGVDGVGKTTFADHLAAIVRAQDRDIIRASVDGFHNPHEHRYRLGRNSPEGFYRDSYNYAALRSCLLEPLSPGGSRQYRTAVFDHRTDLPVDSPVETAPESAILIVDGIFLQRPEIRHFWNLVIFLDAPFEVTVPRGARRGPDFGSPDPHAASNKRYVEGQKLYIAEAIPLEHASIVIDNSRLFSPFIVQRKLVDVERVSIELSPLP